MNSTPLVTIGITCFNAEDTIVRAINSALNQLYSNTEIIIVDDGSTDNSIDLINNLIDKNINDDKNLTLIEHSKNMGAPSAYNTIVENAKGKYVCFFDDDDVSLAERVEKTVATLENEVKKNAVCFCDRFVAGSEKIIKGLTTNKITSEQLLEYMLDSLCYHYDISLYRKETERFKPLKKHGISGSSAGLGILTSPLSVFKNNKFDSKMLRYCDTEWNLRIAESGTIAINVNEPLVKQYLSEGSEKSRITEKRSLMHALLKHEKLYSKYNVYYPSIHFIDNEFYKPTEIVSNNYSKQPLVTIGLLTFNCADTIIKALESALFQTYKNIEIIIVDDASTDNTLEIVKQFNDPRILIIESSINRGAGYNRNIIIDHAKGEYTAFFDDDDVALPDRIESQLNALLTYNMKNKELKLISLADFYHYAGGFLGPRHGTGVYDKYLTTDALERLVWHVILMHTECKYLLTETRVPLHPYALGTSLMCAKTEIFRELKFDPVFRRMQDLEFLVRFSNQGGEMVNFRKPVIEIRSSPGEEKSWWKVVSYSTKIFKKHPNNAKRLFGFDTEQIIFRNNLKVKLLKRLELIKKYI